MEFLPYVWIGLFILFLIIEGMTMELVTIWFALGSLCAYIVSLMGAPFWLQLTVFLVSTILMLVLVFPFVRRKLKVGGHKTNVDSLVGRKAVITEKVEFNKIGVASINGVLWSATGEGTFDVGETVLIKEVKGNRLIIQKLASD